MKCTIKEMIEYLSAFPPEAEFSLEYSGCGQDLEPETAYFCINGEIVIEHDEDFSQRWVPPRNTSLEYTGENYSD